MSQRIALITGATSGIGLSTAKILAQHNYKLILTGRRLERLNQIQSDLSEITEVITLQFDVCNKNEVATAINSLPQNWKNIDILINNAGLSVGLDLIQDGNIEDWDQMINTNVKGLLYCTHKILPLLRTSKNAHIINVGSIAGREVYPKGNVYCASKHAVEALTKGMRIDLLEDGIKVSSVSPGLVETEFSLVRYKGDMDKANSAYIGIEPLTPDDIAESIWFILNQPERITIADITIFPKSQASSMHVHRKS